MMSDIWYALQDQNKYFYHYTNSSAFAEGILAAGKLRFSRFQNVNDPRESKNWLFGYYNTNSIDLDFQVIEEKLNESLKHSWRVGCFASDPYEALVTKKREDAGEDILGAIYERGHSRPRMWAHNGENYKGSCLVFDKAKLDADIRASAKAMGSVVYAREVEYRNPRVVVKLGRPDALMISVDEINRLGFDGAVQAHISRHWKELFFLKSRDWEQEREYRWVVSGNGNEDFYIDIRNALVGIALGNHFPDTLKPDVAKYAQANPVSLAIMNWKNGVPQPHPHHWRLLVPS